MATNIFHYWLWYNVAKGIYTMNICCVDNEFEISWSARLCDFPATTRSMLSLKTLANSNILF